MNWPKDITIWQEVRTGYMSIPFTWLLPKAQRLIDQGDLFCDRWVVGGPAVQLMPDYLQRCIRGHDCPGMLQRVNPMATRTTLGCPNRCKFCGVGQRKIEPQFVELPDWPDRPILCDNNLLAASMGHFHRVVDRLEAWPEPDFNQGLDARLLTAEHARRLAKLKQPVLRLALDRDRERNSWADAVERLRTAGVPKSRICSYVLCGFEGDPEQDRARCEHVESFGVKCLPMWFHPLDALRHNAVTEQQAAMGWTKRKQRELMCWYYQHRTLEVRG